MALSVKGVLQRIQEIRKSKLRKVKDCAAFLNISKEDYRNFERGKLQLSLPEVELLAGYLDVPIQSFFQDEPYSPQTSPLHDKNIRLRYKKLRQKMIQAMLIIEQTSQGNNLDHLYDLTQISTKKLKSYQRGKKSIPLDHFLAICKALKVTPEVFFHPSKAVAEQDGDDTQPVKWQPEFPEELEENTLSDDDVYQTLIDAIKNIPIEAQAELAKTVLNKLKTS